MGNNEIYFHLGISLQIQKPFDFIVRIIIFISKKIWRSSKDTGNFLSESYSCKMVPTELIAI